MNNYKELNKYGVKLIRLTKDKIELVRKWRNDDKISKYMIYRDYITADMQAKWFLSINNEYNYYFIIEIGNKEIGLFNFKDIDYEQGVSESGIFIYDDEYLNGTYSFQIVLCAYDFYFEALKLKKIRGHILASNKRALRYNKALGFCIKPDSKNSEHCVCELTYDKYLTARENIKKMLNLK